jgi:hypothetical protein
VLQIGETGQKDRAGELVAVKVERKEVRHRAQVLDRAGQLVVVKIQGAEVRQSAE